MIPLSNFEKLLCRPLAVFACSYILGCVCAGKRKTLFILAVFTAGLLLIVSERWMRKPFRIRSIIYCITWLLTPLFFWAGLSRTCEVDIPSPLKARLVRSVTGEAAGIISDISIKSDGYILTLEHSSAVIGQETLYANKINIIYSAGDGSDVFSPSIGQYIRAVGKLYPFEKATNPGQFDSDIFYRIRGIDAKMYADTIESPNRGSTGLQGAASGTDAGPGPIGKAGYAFLDMLYRMRVRLTEGIYAVLPEKEAGTLTAMLTGDRGLLDSEVRELYSEGGIAHILSISALHVTLLGMGLFRLLMFLFGRLRISCIATILLMLAYGMMTGFAVSTQRAVTMIVIAMLAKMTGRTYDRMSACSLAALLILAVQPLYIYDAGFRLSFMAVIGINVMLWVIETYNIENPLLRTFLPCVSVQLFTLPVVMGTYFEISLYAILVNPLVLIFMAMLLVSGAVAGTIGAIYAGIVAHLFAGPAYFILKLYELLCEAETKLPYSKLVTGAPQEFFVLCYYMILTIVMLTVIRKKYRPAAFGLLLCGCVFIQKPVGAMETYFLDVGQGDCALVRNKNANILIDGGSSNISKVGKYRMIPFLKYLGITRLDMVMVSHTDTDHTCGILELIEKGYPRIGCIVMGYNTKENQVASAARAAGIEIIYTEAGDSFIIDDRKQNDMTGIQVRIIAPEAGAYYEDANSASVTAVISEEDYSVLFTGDSGFLSESRYINRLDDRRIAVLKTAHHGSRYSTSREMLDEARPVVSVISCSKYNSYGHPAPATLERLKNAGSETYITCNDGMVAVFYDGNGAFTVEY